MLIIFDLDDTLIDTSACITPIKLVDALRSMRKAGLALANWDAAESMIKQLDASKESAKETLIEFLEIHGADKRFLEIGLKEVYENLSLDMPILPVNGALALLEDLKVDHDLAIVTVGKEERQLKKMKKAGIDHTLFCKIVATEYPDKKSHYQMLMREQGFLPHEVVVLGDRIAGDLVPAKALGCKTVHVQHGRGRQMIASKMDADYTITELEEVRDILKEVMNEQEI
ncbi:MAG: HAD family hydrolase [Chlamydiales bacterium]